MEGQDEDGLEDDDGHLVHDVETSDDIKLPKGGGNRGRTWTIKEDKALCEVWIVVSQDAITGTQQTFHSYYSRIYKDFLERTAYPTLSLLPSHKANGIEKWWGFIRDVVNKFHGC